MDREQIINEAITAAAGSTLCPPERSSTSSTHWLCRRWTAADISHRIDHQLEHLGWPHGPEKPQVR